MQDILATIINFFSQPEGLVFILGAIVSLGVILAAFSVHRTRVLVLGVIIGITAILEYYIAGTYAALAIGIVGLFRTTTLLLAQKVEKLQFFQHWISSTFFLLAYPLVFLMINDLTKMEWYMFLPLVGAWLNVIAFWTTDMLITKNVQIGVSAVWLVYEATTGLYTQMIGDSVAMIGLIVSVITLVKGRKAGIADEAIKDVEDILVKTLTGAIPVITKPLTRPIRTLSNTSNPERLRTKPIPVQLINSSDV